VRDCLHPADVVPLLDKQMNSGGTEAPKVVNVSGGAESAFSLLQLGDWCRDRLGPHEVAADPRDRPFDVPWLVLDSSLARQVWGFRPTHHRDDLFDEILRHAEAEPAWLDLSASL